MKVADRIAQIVNRCERIHVSLARVCLEAEVNYGNVNRWRNGGSATVDNFETTMTKIESCLSRLEDDLRKALSADFDNRRRA